MLSELDFCLAYLDIFDDAATDSLITMQETRLQDDKKVRKKMAFLMTECFQNVIRHTEASYIDFDKLFVIQSKQQSHNIITINPINSNKREALESSLAKLELLSEDELKQIYLDSLRDNSFSSKGGAGLGLIEIFRRTKRLPRYEFYRLTNELSAFKIELDINEDENSADYHAIPTEFYHNLSENRILILQKSDFSQESVLSLFELIENNQADSEFNASRSKKLYLLIELLQNMSTNTEEINGVRSGIFQISLSEADELIFETGNCISNEKAVLLENRLEKIINLSRIELIKKYNRELLKGLDEDDHQANAGIGLLEILKLTQGRLKYEIQPFSDSHRFITFKATIEK